MWLILFVAVLTPAALPHSIRLHSSFRNYAFFNDDQVIFSSNLNITKILVPVDGKYLPFEDIPTIFFTVSDPDLYGGTCIYVLADFYAYEVLEGGRDTTTAYGVDKTVYFGAKDGLYIYDAEAKTARKFGNYSEDIIQLQKENGSEDIYVLLANYSLYKLSNYGDVQKRVEAIHCATEFVLDTSNNIYFTSCNDNLPHIVLNNGRPRRVVNSFDFKEVTLLRPAFIMQESIPFFGDNILYILDSKGLVRRKDFKLADKPTAYSVDAALYLVAAVDGKLYEFNIMEILLKSMFGLVNRWPNDGSKMVLDMLDNVKDV